MENIGVGLEMMLYGIGTTFSILIIFYFSIKLLSKLFPEK
ncbi:Oxaloacetate decarboxylase, gamma chain [Proteiniborus ethanoligenes]|uniref:Oxaloacetate decarboxylase, gamma chain n=1 Tax=Proteiniborus ethanoligenes TaxID=415015 RepID=A0A1H3NYZ4_9FIRM|nr:OadG family protein [Proteiniborus ethanoligenes]SDY93933.1 Oxaloacetate decarboxylase, gamma chain [Proteiniborus ethanoligenes]